MRRVLGFTILLQLLVRDASASRSDLLLFSIARSTNANIVRYVAHLTDQGGFDKAEPISAYWVMAAEDGHREELTWLERGHAYGFTVLPSATGKSLNVTIKAMENVPISISIIGGEPRAEVEIAGRVTILQRVFVQVSGGIIPRVETIALSGVDADTGKKIDEVIRP